MITHISTLIHDPCTEAEEADITIIYYESDIKPEDKSTLILRRFLKWFGFLSTLVLGAGALAPDMFHVPTAYRPWVFVIFIFWFVAFCAGFFSQ